MRPSTIRGDRKRTPGAAADGEDLDPVVLLAERLAADLLVLLGPLRAAVGDGRRVRLTGHGLACQLHVWPAGLPAPAEAAAGGGPDRDPDADLRDVERAVMRVVRASGGRLPFKRVWADLRGSGYGKSTVEKALGRLVRAGRLSNFNDKRGYGLR